jgi:hypothetical protein
MWSEPVQHKYSEKKNACRTSKVVVRSVDLESFEFSVVSCEVKRKSQAKSSQRTSSDVTANNQNL